ncbi:MAG: NGG1p interacting factor NIF3 [Patescibacteria group bacterium]|nr:NGG1p interacting factor NIF3 [Patescibacteria group bacterium]
MTINQIYALALKMGIEADPRPATRISKILGREKEKYQSLKGVKREVFDRERIKNPYADTRILFGNGDKVVRKVMTGVDIGSGEVLLAQKMGVDLMIAHHPLGIALAGLDNVMELQADLLASYGIPINIAESLLEVRMSEVARGIAAVNHQRIVDLARLAKLPLMCVHTPCDNMVYQQVNKKIVQKGKTLDVVGDIMDLLYTFPEYKEAAKLGAGPVLFAGKRARRAGKIALTELTGGTEGNKEMYKFMANAGIGTIIGMHMSEPHRKEAEKYHINVIIAGHIASDSIGMNVFLDELEKKGIKIIPCSGLIRK